MANTKKKSLSGHERLYVNTPGKGYRIVEGIANVFITTVVNGENGRGIFVLEATKGTVIPSLAVQAPVNILKDDLADWTLSIVPNGEIVVEEIKCSAHEEENFCKLANIDGYDDLGYEEALTEYYRIELVRDVRNIYAAGESNALSRSKPLVNIYNLFNSKVSRSFTQEQTPNHLYNAATTVCQYMNISYSPLQLVYSACGRKFTIYDFARISGFACREILLTNDWYKLDVGPILAFYGDSKLPVAITPRYKGKGYDVYFSDSGEVRRLTKEDADKLHANAYMFYRRFAQESLDIKKLTRFALNDVRKSDIISIVIFALICMLIGLLIPYVNEQIYDLFIPMGDSSGLLGVGAVIIACTTGNLAFSLVKTFCNFRVSNRMKYSVQAASLDRLFNLPQSFHDKYESADLAKRALSISEIFKILCDTVLTYGITMIFSLLYLFRMFDFSDKLAWAAIIMLALSVAIIVRIGFKQIPYERKKVELSRKNSSLMFQMFTGITKLRIAGATDRGVEQYMNGFIEESKVNIDGIKYDHLVSVLSTALSTIFSVVFFFMVVKSGDTVTAGKFVGFTSAFGGLSGAVLGAASQWLTLNNVIPIYDDAKPILEELPEKEEDIVLPSEINGQIDVNNITFSYTPDSAPILHDLSFSIKPGEYIGIVGGSGSGKSTLLKLLLGFEKPQTGKIYYDGQDIDSIDKRELRKQFGVVLQNGGLITGSIQDNIKIARPHASLAEVKEAIQSAGLEDDIAEMPMGIHTVLSEGSGGVSGGQKQRILIARAIVGKPKILFFDEATSALDNNTQATVCESLASLKATRVVIAHRLSTIMNCDRIFVLDKGHIAEQGTFDELMKQQGFFYELAKRQL